MELKEVDRYVDDFDVVLESITWSWKKAFLTSTHDVYIRIRIHYMELKDGQIEWLQ